MNQKTQAKRSFPYVTVLLVILLGLAVAILLYSVLNSTGLFGRLNTAARSDNYKISENELCVYKYHAAQNQFYMAWLYDAYGLTSYDLSSTYGSVDVYMNYMIYQYAISYPHAFDEEAYAYAEQYLIYCEGATEAGVTLTDEEKAQIDEYMDGLQTMADYNGVSLTSYIHSWIGTGVSQSDVRKAMEIYYLGTKYAEIKSEELSDAVTDEEIDQEVSDNKSSYYTTKYTYYNLVNADLADQAKECTTVDELKALIVSYYVDQKFESLYKELITDNSITDEAGEDKTREDVLTTVLAWEELTEDEAVFTATSDTEESSDDTDETSDSDVPANYNEAGYRIATAIDSSALEQFNKIYETGSASYADPTGDSASDLQKWLFGDGRMAGDTNAITTTTTDSSTDTTTTSATWYLVTEVMVRDEEKTKNAYYVTLEDDDEDTEDGMTADEKYAALEALKDATIEEKSAKFEEIFGASLQESLSQSSLSDEIGEWLYDESRQVGDFDRLVVKVTSTDSDGLSQTVNTDYVILYVSENEENYRVSARSTIAENKLSDWIDQITETYHVSTDYVADETTAS
jgi:hypothetical protein